MGGSKSQFPDKPKSLKDEAVKQERRSLLEQSHVATLTEFVDEIRDRKLQEHSPDFRKEHIPYFDPLDGGVKSRCLFLFEAPGGRALKSGFVSRNNPDETARTFFELNERAGLDRCLTVSWNIVPWYLGSDGRIRAARSADINQGLKHLWDLLDLLKPLDVIVLGGRKAQRATNDIKESRVADHVLEMWHPSPQSLNRVPSRREEISEVLRDIANSVS